MTTEGNRRQLMAGGLLAVVVVGVLILVSVLNNQSGGAGGGGGNAGAPGPPVTIQYRFTAGQVDHYQATMRADVPLSLNLAGATAQNVKASVTADMTVKQVVRSVDPDGTGHLLLKVPMLSLNATAPLPVQPLKLQVRWNGHAFSGTVNGEPLGQDDLPPELGRMLQTGLPLLVTRHGQVMADLAMQALGPEASQLQGLLAQSPALAGTGLQVGDTWKLSGDFAIPGLSFAARTQLKLAGVEQIDGKRAARFEGLVRVQGEGDTARLSPDDPTQIKVEGVEVQLDSLQHVGLDRGVLFNASLQGHASARMSSTAPASQGPARTESASLNNAQLRLDIRRQGPRP